MKTLLLTFDVEQFPSKELGIPLSEDKAFSLGKDGLNILLDILDITSSTFFVTAEFAERFPKDTKRILTSGHELAMHGASHDHVYHTMEEKKAKDIISKAKGEMEKRFKTKIKGFRGPRMSRPSYEILKKCGFTYDSSLHPVFLPGHYNNFFSPRCVQEREDIIVIPVSAVPLVRLPFSWAWFRIMGSLYTKACSRLTLLDSSFIHLYFHPWEFVEPPVKAKGIWHKLNFGGTGITNVERLEKFITWTKKRGLAPSTLSGFLKF